MNWQKWAQYSVRQATILRNKQCAVLVPLVETEGELQLVFEIRSSRLSWQPGDICFPGGRLESHDKTPVDGAIRETIEEMGIERSQIQVLGCLDYVESPVGVTVYPVAAYIETDHFSLSDGEVETTFTVPVSWFLEHEPMLTAMEIATRPVASFPRDILPQISPDWIRRRDYDIYIYQYGSAIIWGITAQIVHGFIDRFRQIERNERKE